VRSERTPERRSDSAEETAALAARLAEVLMPPDLVCLEGDLGSGKTVFVQGLAAGLGVAERAVSPTFMLQRVYRGRVPLYHFDLFRLENGVELDALGLGLDQSDGITVIEWSDRAPALARWERTLIRLEVVGNGRRVQLLQAPQRVRVQFLAD
jgi:tRNA threonylcarbamoyladenosine biosynthesis protein TsaE